MFVYLYDNPLHLLLLAGFIILALIAAIIIRFRLSL